jgi:prophage regulatory protein
VSSSALMRRPAVLAATGLSKSYLYQLVAEGRFPAPRKIGMRAVAWNEADVREWIDSRPPVFVRAVGSAQ